MLKFAIYQEGKTSAFEGWKKDIEFSFEDVKFEMSVRHLCGDVDRQLEIEWIACFFVCLFVFKK